MAIVRPFSAVRPAKPYADKVISLPYDVMNREEAAQMAGENPYSFLHICRSEIDLPAEIDPYSEEVYLKAKDNIATFLADGILIKDEKPMLYLYRQIMNGRVQTGIVGCVSVDDYQNDIIKKHEFTRVEKELDRINHFDVCNANTEPVFLTYKENKNVSDIIEKWINNNESEYDMTTPDGVRHILWAIRDEDINRTIVERFKDIKSLYIADGHHRSASAVKVGLKRRQENPNYTGEEEFNYFMAVIFPDKDLKIFDYNRVVEGLNGLTQEKYLDKIKISFDVIEVGNEPYRPEQKHDFGMYLDKKWYKLTAKYGTYNENHVIKSLDVSILQNNLLAPILGIKDPRTDHRIDFVGGIRGLQELERRADTDMTVAFSLYPASISELMSVSDKGMVMPPKSTWFEPKLGSGLFIHQLD